MNFALILLTIIAGIVVWALSQPHRSVSPDPDYSYSQQYIKCRDHYTASVVHTEKEKQQLINLCTAFTSQRR
jgi:hypothetical protein